MVLPIGENAFQHVGTAQEGAVGRIGRAHHNVIAAAGAAMASVQHEFFRRKAAGMRLLIQDAGDFHLFPPIPRGMNIDFDHAGIGGDFDDIDARIEGRRIAFDMHDRVQLFRGRLHHRQQGKIILRRRHGRHEHTQPAVARFHRQGGSHHRLAQQFGDGPVDGVVGSGLHRHAVLECARP